MTDKPISPDFPYESKFLDVLGSKIHYIDEGEGETILFIHGNPTCNYLWRNVIPHLSGQARCIAPDLIGMGKSDKPDIRYGFFDSYRYLSSFIDQLQLKNVTLVLHDWGSGLGFHYANENRDNIRAMAFMESLHDMPSIKDLPTPVRIATALIRNPVVGKFFVGNLNLLLKKVMPQLINRDLTEAEQAVYSAPYETVKSRKPLWVWPQDAPLDPTKRTPVREAFEAWREWLPSCDIPKLCLYATPGSAIQEKDAEKIRETFSNTKVVNVGEGQHHIQEDCPHEIGEALAKWYGSTVSNPVTNYATT
ncbi:MAG: haloalkane dehalogenase [Planctomycetota bacterium]